jgi:2-polyprenyl-3-methyl-5-hydroxy-6-metoxy-1,4-benzoquinol methylase
VTVDAPPPAPARAGASPEPAARGAALAAPILAGFDRRRLRILRRHIRPPARVLDSGAGRGRFVLAARRAGYDAEGIELDPARAAAAAAAGAPVRAVGIEDADVPAGSLDAVVCWHVLEHVAHPAAAAARLAGWLRPGGVLLAGTPNLASLQARIGGARWYHLDLPRHRTHFTVAGLHALLRGAGLETVATHHVLAEQNPYGMWQSLVNRATPTPSYLFRFLKREVPLHPGELATSLIAVPLLPLAALAELAAGLAGRGGTVAAVTRMPGP